MDENFSRASDIFDRLVRGDALIGVMEDAAAEEARMLEYLWRSARAGNAGAYAMLADCFLANVRSVGAYDGASLQSAEGHVWSQTARRFDHADPYVRSALRCLCEASLLGGLGSAIRLGRLVRDASADCQQLAIEVIDMFVGADGTGGAGYQKGLILNWLGEFEASAAAHEQAAEHGNPDAIFELSILYREGLGVPADRRRAQAMLERAAELHHPRALFNLAASTAIGADGTPRDVAKAASLYERALEDGHGRAAANLAVMMLVGDVPGTPERICELLGRAEELGFDASGLLDALDIEDPRAPGAGAVESVDSDAVLAVENVEDDSEASAPPPQPSLSFFLSTHGDHERVHAPLPAPPVLEALAAVLPPTLVRLWRDKGGFTEYANGLFWIVDPTAFEEVVARWGFDPSSVFGVLRTGMGGLVVFDASAEARGTKQRVRFLDPVFGEITPLTESFEAVLNGWLTEPSVYEPLTLSRYFQEALPRLGRPSQDECFAFDPPLAEGGSLDADRLVRTSLTAYLERSAPRV